MSTPNLATMSDDEIMRMELPNTLPSEVSSEDEAETFEDQLNVAGSTEDAKDEPVVEASDSPEEDHTTPKQTAEDVEDAETGTNEDAADAADTGKDEEDAPAQGTSEAPEDEAGDAPESASDAEEDTDDVIRNNYEKIMAPFKANGREIQLKTPEDVIQLMQMGANYTKKMQALKPALKVVRMLENNNLLDAEKISFLIDLEKKNPQAIHKLLHEGNIDPLDLDTASEPAYKPGNHAVSDQEMAFHDAVGDVRSTHTGMETIKLIDTSWDQPSKQAVFQHPEILRTINDHRAQGIYDIIVAEVENQRMLGRIGSEVPFIHAYKQVGDTLNAEGRFTPAGSDGNPQSTQPAPRVLETRTARPRKSAANGDKARAASPARSAPKTPPKPLNLGALSDEEIMAIPLPR